MGDNKLGNGVDLSVGLPLLEIGKTRLVENFLWSMSKNKLDNVQQWKIVSRRNAARSLISSLDLWSD